MEKERIDNLGINGYQIIQKEQGFCFGMDAVLLSDFVFPDSNVPSVLYFVLILFSFEKHFWYE